MDALLEAENLEGRARKARRQAMSRLRYYERLLAEHNGQMPLFQDPK